LFCVVLVLGEGTIDQLPADAVTNGVLVTAFVLPLT
jgi:hypothetical protein